MKILCLDDDLWMRATTVDLLRDLGHDVIEADKGADAMRWIRRCGDEIDLLLLDIRMPSGPDGREVTSFARQFHPNMPVIYLTAFEGRQVADRPRDWFLSKPCSAGTLRQALDDVSARPNHRHVPATSGRLSGPARWTRG